MKAIVCVGPAASGKSTYSEALVRSDARWVETNRDNLRWKILGEKDWSKWKWSKEKKVSGIIDDDIRYTAENGWNLICSDTNLNPKYRNLLIDKLKGYGYTVEIKEFDVDLEELYRRDKLRENSVGFDVIYRQWLQFQEYKGFKKYEPDVALRDAVIVDVDGTVASMQGVRGPFEWGKVGLDNPISTVMDIVDGLYNRGYSVVFLSGRDGVCYKATRGWLQRYFKFPIELYMREPDDMRKDYVIKSELFWSHVADQYNVRMVIDDRSQVIERLWKPLGIKVINVGNINERF
jgi:predicted kinase